MTEHFCKLQWKIVPYIKPVLGEWERPLTHTPPTLNTQRACPKLPYIDMITKFFLGKFKTQLWSIEIDQLGSYAREKFPVEQFVSMNSFELQLFCKKGVYRRSIDKDLLLLLRNWSTQWFLHLYLTLFSKVLKTQWCYTSLEGTGAISGIEQEKNWGFSKTWQS